MMYHSSKDGQNSKETADFKINPTPLEKKEFSLPLLDLIKIFFISIVLEVPKLLISLIQHLMKKPKSLKDKICLVTGAGRGLGRELCIKLANLQAIVVCVDIRKDINNETVKLIKDSGGKAYGYTCNVAKYEEVTKLAETVHKEVGRVYMLVNNAALIMSHHAGEWPPEEVISMFNVNVISHFWTIQAFLPSMKEVNEGHIVGLLSMAAIIPSPSISVYSATKAAAESLLNIFRLELNSNNDNKIVITNVYPSLIKTNQEITAMFKTGMINFLSVEEAAQSIIQGILYDKTSLMIPPSIYWFIILYRNLPDVIKTKLINASGMNLNVPSKEYKENIPFNDIKKKCL